MIGCMIRLGVGTDMGFGFTNSDVRIWQDGHDNEMNAITKS
jgi:hypothetical protein